MNETTVKLIHWIWGEPALADFLREIARGDEFEYGDNELGDWIASFVFPENRSREILAWERIGGSETRVSELYEKLTAGRKSPAGRLEWLDEMDTELIRNALIGDGVKPYIYVHATVKGFHPNNRYRVHDRHTVYEPGWTSASGAWGLAEPDRQVCPEPIDRPCSCVVDQRERER